MPVSQSSVLWKSPGKIRRTRIESVGSGVDGSSTRNVTESRPSLVSSVAWIEFCQLNEPNRTGVSKLSAVTRVPASSAMVSSHAARQDLEERVALGVRRWCCW